MWSLWREIYEFAWYCCGMYIMVRICDLEHVRIDEFSWCNMVELLIIMICKSIDGRINLDDLVMNEAYCLQNRMLNSYLKYCKL